MGIRYNDPRLFAGGIALTCLFAGFIAWGQLKPNVTVNQPWEYPSAPITCPDFTIDPSAYIEAMSVLEDNNIVLHTLSGPCDGRGNSIHYTVSVADVDRISPPTGGFDDGVAAQEAFELLHNGTVISTCNVFLVSPTDVKSIVHGTLHCMGYQHAIAAPTGHVMNSKYDRIGLKDFRGIK